MRYFDVETLAEECENFTLYITPEMALGLDFLGSQSRIPIPGIRDFYPRGFGIFISEDFGFLSLGIWDFEKFGDF